MPEDETPTRGQLESNGSTTVGREADEVLTRATIQPPGDQRLIYRAEPRREVVGARRAGFDVSATIGGALAALGMFVLLSAIVGGVVGSIGYQTEVEGRDLGPGGLIAGLVVLLVSCLVGGWVAGRIARRRHGLHGLVAALWLVLLAAALTALAALAGDDLDVRNRVGLPDWFSSDALGTTALITGVVALVLMLLGGWLGGRLGERHRDANEVELVAHRTGVRRHSGGIIAEGPR